LLSTDHFKDVFGRSENITKTDLKNWGWVLHWTVSAGEILWRGWWIFLYLANECLMRISSSPCSNKFRETESHPRKFENFNSVSIYDSNRSNICDLTAFSPVALQRVTIFLYFCDFLWRLTDG
jgi:hypothetical protein